ncbi:hypothetical protein Nepgr_003526 [Nepenthes gracilis]|uniref:PAS domain-containing protein n=1 Tax=Nepenthes gracilis TaxID=150966 RepID=A0AAD3RZR8_NEPGR|nr:hypothetical protein Nepgr_003526 [Nepenthes gracilis]
MESQQGVIQKSFFVQYSNWVHEDLDALPDNFTITDPFISGHPIVFASRGFLKMCGYSKEEVIGKNGRMFQGPATNRRSVMKIREAIREARDLQINLLNYRKDGTPFWMLFRMSPVFSKKDGKLIHFVAVQVPIHRKPMHLGSGIGRNGVHLCENGYKAPDSLLWDCRREVFHYSMLELGRGLAFDSKLDSDKGIEVEDLCTLESGSRCSVQGTGLLSSALIVSLGRIKQSFALIDPHSPGMPIVYASDAFLELTGYATEEVLECSQKYLSSSDTDSSTLLLIDESIQFGEPCTVHALNYRKDQSSFWNLLHVSPVRNASGKAKGL